MGNWYANISVRGVSQSDVVTALRKMQRTAFVSRSKKGHVVIYDSVCRKMDGDDSERLAAAMTSQFGCRAIIALNADDDVLWLCGYDRGERIGEYDSSTPQRSGAGHIAGVAGRSFATPILWIIFQMPFVFELFRHLAACKVLGLPGDICTYGYPGDDEDRILPGVPEGLFQATDEGYLC